MFPVATTRSLYIYHIIRRCISDDEDDDDNDAAPSSIVIHNSIRET